MNKKRLLKLADLLEADAKNKKGIKFDLGEWGTVSDPEKPLSCGTIGCAMGLAAVSGAFKRAGLSYKLDSFNHVDIEFFSATQNTTGGFSSAAYLFDIKFDEALELFDPDHYPPRSKIDGAAGERMVAKRIRAFVAGKYTPDAH